MAFSLIQIITLFVFIGSLSVSFIYDIWKNKKLRLGIVETTIVPILIGLIILYFDFDFIFTNNNPVSIFGLLILIGGLTFGFLSLRFLGKKQRRLLDSKEEREKENIDNKWTIFKNKTSNLYKYDSLLSRINFSFFSFSDNFILRFTFNCSYLYSYFRRKVSKGKIPQI